VKSVIVLASVVLLVLPHDTAAGTWKMKPVAIPTRWAASVSPSNVLLEYPRPQLVRAQWQSLNGLWDYRITARDAPTPTEYSGQILVPYALESALSGVQGSLKTDERLWYRRLFTLEGASAGTHTLLHFGAVDFEATVYVNGKEIGVHRGGYEHFSMDITDAAKRGDNELVVKVWDPTDSGPNPHGKQGYQHTAASGIWQTVWLERVPESYIQNLKMTPDVDRKSLALEVEVENAQPGDLIEAIARQGSKIVSRSRFKGATALHFERPHLWSPDDPYLYDLELRVLRGKTVIDRVTSYFGLRKIEVRPDAAGLPRIFLNNRFTYQLGTLDRGWWPDGIFTAPTDEALKFDIQVTKTMGFNTIRKHVKVEPERWYYHCDKLGVLVWQDMVYPARFNPEALSTEGRAEFESEVHATLAQLHNHPSIVQWVLFNEGWGAYDQERLARWVKSLDSSRILDAHSGPEANPVQIARWFWQADKTKDLSSGDIEGFYANAIKRAVSSDGWVGGDVIDAHHYPDPRMPPSVPGKAQLLGEHGGVGVRIEGHVWNELIPGYNLFREVPPDEFPNIYADFVHRLKTLKAQGLSGSIYTNPFDVEAGEYGLVTYDRAVTKIPLAQIAKLNDELVPRSKFADRIAREISIQNADITPLPLLFATRLAEYQRGRRDELFARRLTLLALRLKDQAHATEIGNAVVAGFPQPYSSDAWAFIRAATHTSKDAGFAIFRAQASAADAALGANAAEVKVREIIANEELKPVLAGTARPPRWNGIEQQLTDKYGVLGSEALAGVRMEHAAGQQDWPEFGKASARYLETAATRSEYAVGALGRRVCRHVDDAQALDIAIKSLRWDIEMGGGRGLQGKENPYEFDTYACVLYKRGRFSDALAAQERAVQLSAGRDSESNADLEKIKAGRTLWDGPYRAQAACGSKGTAHFICGLDNSEDLVAVPDSPWIVASGLADSNGLGGGLYLIDRRDHSWRTLYPDIAPVYHDIKELLPLGPENDCKEPVDALHFSAHGIHLRAGSGQRHILYVVNHGSRESIEIFELDLQQSPVARWKGCLLLPNRAVANSVVSLPDGGLAVTVMYLSDDTEVERKLEQGEVTGYVLEWQPKEGWSPVPGSEGSFPNGLEVSSDGHWLYISNTGQKNIVRLSRGADHVERQAVKVGFSSDNLRWSPNGRLLVAGQLSGCGSERICTAPYEMLELNPDTLKFERLDHPDTAPEFGAASVALSLGDDVWVGTYRGDRIAYFELQSHHQ
jgi:Glycosyl hydrolases family 2, sugar binding domain/Glycosyl hydrolases family 2/Glycosyl hydrolases family 2, TIM barrel domain